MGHLVGKDLYKRLGKKIDALTMRAPWSETFYQILKEIYTPEEAEIIVKMPYGLSSFERIAKTTKCDETKLRTLLEGLCSKGLVVDVWMNGGYQYMPSPMVIGIFEFTMMRTDDHLDRKKIARLFHQYLQEEADFYAANLGHGERISIMRTLPHEEAIDDEHVEVLDYEKATAIVEGFDRFAVGLCSCRHEKFHLDEKPCEVPLEKCSSFGPAADYLVRHNLAREISKSEMLENIAQSKEQKLVLTADNIKNNAGFICHCCKCCCNLLLGISVHGYSNTLVTSSFLSKIEEDKCTGCEKCAKACPINAIEMVPIENPKTKKPKNPKVDTAICLGCGVCALVCHKDAVTLVKRQQRVIYPETTFERVILQSLERGTLQNQIFDDPQNVTQKVMRGIVGGFLRLPPVKRALMSDRLRSRFLASMKAGVSRQGKGWLAKA